MSDHPDNSNGDEFWHDSAEFFKSLGVGPGTRFPLPKIVQASEVRQEATARSVNLLKSWGLLRGIIARHEPTIRRRWLKKSKKQRVGLLIEAWPGMAPTHRPDFDAFRKETPEQEDVNTPYRDCYMFPYINQEDLSKPKLLLLFLDARARCHPSDFAGTDDEATHFGRLVKSIVPIFLKHHVMLLNGVTNATEYGKLLYVPEQEDAIHWLKCRNQYLPGDGLLVLEAQERILSFLVQCCQYILHDIPALSLPSTQGLITLRPASMDGREASGFDSLASMAAEASYRPPAQISFNRMISLLEARKSAAEDHLLSLREDPSYFADVLLHLKEHRQELLKDTVGQPHPIFQMRRGHETFWSRIINNTVTDAYLGCELWDELVVQAQRLKVLRQIHAKNILPTMGLPEEYLDALLKFRHYLKQAIQGPWSQLGHHLAASPPLRPFFERAPCEDPDYAMIRIMSRREKKQDRVEFQLLWLLSYIREDGLIIPPFRLIILVDELERLIQAEPKARGMLTDHIANQVSDLSILCECQRQLCLYQPWANKFEDAMVEREESLEQELEIRTKTCHSMVRALDGPTSYARLGDPSDGRFYYPVDKRRTKENIQAMRYAESSLDAFWKKIDQLMHQSAGSLKETAVGRLLSQSRTLRRTPEWVEPTKTVSSSRSSNVEDLIKPFSEFYFDLEKHSVESGAITETVRPKAMVKTRGQPAPLGEVPKTRSPAELPTPLEPQPSIPVDARALKVFRTLFYTPSLTATPGEIPWTDFLHAMVSTGFRTEKLYGSAWQFTPRRLDVERVIQFHEPHPSPKIPYRDARRIGRRLTQTYGWETGLFVLKAKDKRDGAEEDAKK